MRNLPLLHRRFVRGCLKTQDSFPPLCYKHLQERTSIESMEVGMVPGKGKMYGACRAMKSLVVARKRKRQRKGKAETRKGTKEKKWKESGKDSSSGLYKKDVKVSFCFVAHLRGVVNSSGAVATAEARTRMPETQSRTRETRNGMPETENRTPETTSKVPKTRNRTPETVNKTPTTRHRIPEIRHRIP